MKIIHWKGKFKKWKGDYMIINTQTDVYNY